ncbi:MAG: ATP-binding protein [Propionibacteriaceae bacterium]
MSIEPSTPAQPLRRAYRHREGAWLGGVCAGLAEHLGWPVLTLRIGFLILSTSNLIGVIAYGLLWLFLPEQPTVMAPGVEAASRNGLRTATSRRLSRQEKGVVTAVVVFGLGLLALIQAFGLGLGWDWFWPIAAGCVGLALLWRQADSKPRQQLEDAPASILGAVGQLLKAQGWVGLLRIVGGLVFVAAAVVAVGVNQIGTDVLPKAIMIVGAALLGVGLVVAPWIHRYQVQIRDVHESQVLADQKADMAAHLHDSVLQTLALIQRQANDPKVVSQLARKQERELRTWLYGDQLRDATVKSALVNAAISIEDETGVQVELVTVGDSELDDDSRAVVQAAREAMMNAAKHAGVDLIDVYAEVDDNALEVFVRDRGKGFDLDTIEQDRQGVRRSILDRMERHGGHATIKSAPGEGTEVKLELRHDRGND